MRFIQSMICLLILNQFLAACGKKTNKRGRAPVSQYFVHGNPERMIEGATLNDKSSIFDLDQLDSLQGFHVTDAVRITTRSTRFNPKNWQEIETSNSTDDAVLDEGFSVADYYFETDDNVSYTLAPQAADPDRDWIIGFTLKDGKLWLQDIGGAPVKALHYSLKDDRKAFSLLFSYFDPKRGESMVSVAFAASGPVLPLPAGVGDFAFLVNNIPLPWEAPPALTACGNFTYTQKATITNSLEAWFKDPEATRSTDPGYPIKLNFESTYPPFSDLNRHCLYFVKDYKLESSDSFRIDGVAMTQINRASKKLFDSDIFIFTDYVSPEIYGPASETIMHEMGHFFGLGHEFKRTELGLAKYPSIMGYELGAKGVSARDFALIRQLYGTHLTASPLPPR